MKKIFLILFSTALVGLTSCHNKDWEFNDFEYQSVYFSYQYPVRTIVLGDDIFDTTLDNEWKCKIMATTGGVYSNPHDVTVDISVDNNYAQDLQFDNGTDLLIMPTTYYSLSDDQIVIKKGELTGGVEVQLTEAFFADPEAIRNTYVIPVQMSNVTAADSILSGVPQVENPRPAVAGDWSVQPKDFILYAIKYINPWHGYYLRRGVDEVTKDGVNTTEVRHQQYVEDDAVWQLTTRSMTEVHFPLDYQNKEGQNLNLEMNLTVDDDLNITVSALNDTYQVNDSVRVYNFVATGTGQFVEDGEVKSWGDQDRDGLYLNYEVGYDVEIDYQDAGVIDTETVHYSTIDTLVIRNRGVDIELFTPIVN
ncbi:DUF1735 domain-containing protein [Gilvimarinus agarilyticus]|uniref:Adhesin n=1 Tax=Reichenbachiella agariperforans TaxID=156994 RepID=A0A1M6KE86_REIAG|nr:MULTISPECIES: DUF5627 domain-containing protein [Reichenbachiella]MBU2884948.1 DUF1735 domain-containing protein [Gilvimarinus agarilyticus]MBU2913524.1 DUF1735 domain-containing protein [Reichenbachiella agariperforans]RJE74510.1 adhesin [Reichenbachiella sp. MSK19-1]SHJ57261.1 protein of unknown function [Reichenbachiella agariperforans]